MNLLALNCRGCAGFAAIQEIRQLVEFYKPKVVFLSETKMRAKRSESLRWKLGFQNAFAVDCSNTSSGGLVMFWTDELSVRLKGYNKYCIDVWIADGSGDDEWRFTGFYGEPKRQLRNESWRLLKFLRHASTLPWICAGDFNEVLSVEEYFGRNGREEWQMAGFKEATEYCNFTDLGYSGLPYTWDNRQEGENNVKVRLDRALADDKFLDRFGTTSVAHIQLTESDHCALLIKIGDYISPGVGGTRYQFRYENMWRRDPSYFQLVNSSWFSAGQNMQDIGMALRNMQVALRNWSYNTFGSVRAEIKKLRTRLVKIRGRSLCSGPTREERNVQKCISELLAREEVMMRQRSRVQWLKEGDRNTSFFQAKCKQRKRQNFIQSLRRDDGVICSEQNELQVMATSYFSTLFTAQEDLQPEEVVHYVPRKISDEMNSILCSPFMEKEVEQALFMMKPNKSPGPDGFTAGFFQTHWDILKKDVCAAVINFLNGGIFPDEMNSTILVLIAKVRHPQSLSEYRPISLCNVIYKICSKVLANQLRMILNDIISAEQSAFIPGRLITDNVLIAYECIHYLRKKKGKSGACALKLDMSKAYDRVEWPYLRSIMTKMGFHTRWVDMVMRCVESVSFSVKVNGQLSERFKPSRGIRQGDPISPYLFLLCAEGLSSLLKFSGPQFLCKGVRVGIYAPWISHLMFADDCLVFTQASKRGAEHLQSIIEMYHKGSGQLVNKSKSTVFFSSNCGYEVKASVLEVLGIEKEALEEKYLGLPTALGRNSKTAFEKITTQVKNLVGGACEKNLSMAGREIFVKSIAQAIPTYSMSSFLLTKNTCKKITSALAHYWWGGDRQTRKMHWKKWEDIAIPKSEGGMGFRDMRQFNIAMLGKQGWRLLTNPDTLCARVLRGKYYHDREFMQATKKKNMSHTWRAILMGRQVLELGMIKRIGNGTSTDVWNDKWIPGVPGFRPLCKSLNASAKMVSDLIINEGWNHDALKENLLPLDADAVTRIPLGKFEEDQWAWAPEKNGVYTVRSAYHLLTREAQKKKDITESSNAGRGIPWKLLWKLSVPPKVRSFWWCVLHDYIPVRNNLQKRHIEKLSQCIDCGADEETTFHALLDCPLARCFWEELKASTGIKLPPLHPVTWAIDILDTSICPSDHTSIILCGMWVVWCERNNRRHGEKCRTLRVACKWAIDIALDLAQEAAPKIKVKMGAQDPTGWTKPEAGVLKLNCDGSFNGEKHTGTTGCIVRDSDGRALGAGARYYGALADALHAEALALRDGVAYRWLDCNLRVETDSQVLLNFWRNKEKDRAEITPILREVERISKRFNSFEISYIPRNANLAAHLTAKEASLHNPKCMWVGCVPKTVMPVVQFECKPT